MASVSLHIIAKNNLDDVKRLVKDYASYFDAVDVAWDNKDCHVEGINNYYYEWDDEEISSGELKFDKKRNFLASKCQTDFYFRLDTDDDIVHPEKIRSLTDRAYQKGVDIVTCFYDYSRDPDSNIVASHFRETIIRNTKDHYWKGVVHETLIRTNDDEPKTVIDKNIVIKHNTTPEHSAKSFERNTRILLREYEKTKDNPDPRIVAYLGRTYYSQGKLVEAKMFLEEHIRTSGWDEDRCMSWIMLADIMCDMGNTTTAIKCCHEAIGERFDFPEPYLKLLQIYNTRKEWDKAIHWGEIGLKIPKKDTMMMIDVSALTWRPYIMLAHAYLNIGEVDKAFDYFCKAEEKVPTLKWVKANRKHFEEAVEHKNFVQRYLYILNFLKENDRGKVEKFLDCIPKNLSQHETLCAVKNANITPKVWGDNEVAIFCGNSWESWAAPSVLKGIGGSEEAVVYLSKELSKKGFKVTVYCQCGELAGEYDGVVYKNHFEANFRDEFNVFVSWRHNIFVYGDIKAKRKIVWLHDVPMGQFPEAKLDSFDTVVVLSEYHRSLLPKYIPNSKIHVSRNGINEADFNLKNQPDRNPKRIIYTSSYDRGIHHLLEMWADIKAEVPEAELHLFYGWDTWIEMEKKGHRDPAIRRKIQSLMAQDGVYEHGRIGHKQLIKEFYKSGIFAYPSHFTEISCISAMKAQRCGCVPLVTNFAALQETVKAGIKVTGCAGVGDTNNRFKDELINLLKDTDYQENLRQEVLKYKDSFSWSGVAKDWVENLFVKKRNNYKDYEDYKKHYVTHGEFHRSNFDENGTIILHKRYQFVIDKIKELGIKSILDAGASDGALCYAINEICKIKADGIEADAKCVEFANDYAKRSSYNSKFTNCLLEEHKTDEKYDAVSALEIIEHVIDPKAFLEKAESFVNDGGYVFISTPEKDGYFGEKNFNPQHIHHFTKESLAELIGAERIIAWDNDEDILTVVYKK